MMDDTRDVVEELARFERRVGQCGLAPAFETVEPLVEESQGMLALLNAAEAENVTAALERDAFAFEEAQSRLRAQFDRFATLVERSSPTARQCCPSHPWRSFGGSPSS